MYKISRLALAASGVLLFATTITPATAISSCKVVATPARTPASHDSPHMSSHATPSAMRVSPEQQFIDMMIPHHESMIALATVAQPLLLDPRLREMANTIISTQDAEVSELRILREARFRSTEPVSLSPTMMQDPELDAEAKLAAFCAASNPDLAFALETLSHHHMAVDESRVFLEKSQDEELRAVAERVITAQESEIAVLKQFLEEHNTATPVP